MKRWIVALVLGLIFSSNANAGVSAQYVGDIGGTLRISVQLRFSDDGKSASGEYFYFSHLQDIRLDATIAEKHIVMREFDPAGNQTGLFVGDYLDSDPRKHFDAADKSAAEVIVGRWSRPDGSKAKPFYLLGGFRIPHGHARGQYSVGGFDDDLAVDTFAAKFRFAVLRHDVQAVAGMMKFPALVDWDGKTRKLPISRREFLRDYVRIFYPGFIDQIAMATTSQMFARDQGVSLGDQGQVWFEPVIRDGKQIPEVITLNNQFWERDEIYGGWRISKFIGAPDISALGNQEVAKLIGARAEISSGSISFTGLHGTVRCANWDATDHTVDADQFLEHFGATFADLGITGITATYYDITAGSKHSSSAPIDVLILKPNGDLITEFDGDFFELTRDDRLPPADAAASAR